MKGVVALWSQSSIQVPVIHEKTSWGEGSMLSDNQHTVLNRKFYSCIFIFSLATLSSFEVLLRRWSTTCLCWEKIRSTPDSEATIEKQRRQKLARFDHLAFVRRKVQTMMGFWLIIGVISKSSVESINQFRRYWVESSTCLRVLVKAYSKRFPNFDFITFYGNRLFLRKFDVSMKIRFFYVTARVF